MSQKFKTFFYAILIVLVIAGCNSTPTNLVFSKHDVNLQMDIENGAYESLAIDYWEPKYNVCFDVNILKTHDVTTKFNPQLAWFISDDDGNRLKLLITDNEEGNLIFIAKFVDNNAVKDDYELIEDNFREGEAFSLKFSLIEPNSLSLELTGSTLTIPLHFIPEDFVINVSGMKARLGYSTSTNNC